jgi:hypothetical protein
MFRLDQIIRTFKTFKSSEEARDVKDFLKKHSTYVQ